MPTIKEVAAQAGVSVATVSHVMNGTRWVSEEARGRVQQAIQALGYEPNRVARNLRVRTTRTIGVIFSDIQNPFFTSVVRGIEDVLQASGYTLLLGNSDEDMARERLYIATLRAEGVAGIIFAPSSNNPEDYRALVALPLPLVAIDRAPPDLNLDLVSVNSVAGARDAVTHLIELGHERVGLVGGPDHLSTALDRQAGYEQALAAAGLPVDRALIRRGDFRHGGGYHAMRGLLLLDSPPTAVFVANNLMTLGALQAVHEDGLRIPQDISLVGFDDMEWAQSLQPPLTAVAQPTYQLGKAAARRLLHRIGAPDEPGQHIVMETQLKVRASCGPWQVEGAGVTAA